MQTKVKFENEEVSITSITSTNDTLLKSIPVSAIRNRANQDYQHTVAIDRLTLTQALSRLLLFNVARGGLYKDFGTIEFRNQQVIMYDAKKENREVIDYKEEVKGLDSGYVAQIDINNLKSILDGCVEDTISISFGNKQCLVLTRGYISNVLPEAHVDGR